MSFFEIKKLLLKIRTSKTTRGGTIACKINSSQTKFPASGSFSISPTGIKIHIKIKHVIEMIDAAVNLSRSNHIVATFESLSFSMIVKHKDIMVITKAKKFDCSVKNIN